MFKVKLFTFILICFAVTVFGQEFKFYVHTYYGSSNYEFKDTNEPFARNKVSAVPIYGLQTSVNLMFSKSFGMGTGINYLRMKGATDPVFIDSGLINPNSTGNFTLDVNSTYLQIPVEFTIIITQKWKVKPFVVAGLNSYIPLKESYTTKMDPLNPSDIYPTFGSEIDKTSEIRGFVVGLGALVSLPAEKELSFRFNYRLNSLNYNAGIKNILSEERVMKFNTIELAVGFRFLKKPLRMPEKKA